MLITIEDDIETILGNYLFEFNDPSIRLEIKAKVDSYLEGVQSAGGIFNFSTIMDSSNNTPDIIDNNMGIIDVIVEPARGIHKFLNRITIAKTGAIASGGFTVA
jgi:phage tail sheath protein FI